MCISISRSYEVLGLVFTFRWFLGFRVRSPKGPTKTLLLGKIDFHARLASGLGFGGSSLVFSGLGFKP